MIFLIIVGAILFSRFIAISRIPTEIGEWLGGLEVSRIVIFLGICILYLFLGTILDSVGMLAITLPVVLPLVETLGYDAIWFAIVVVQLCEIGMSTPPVGINVYVVKSAAGDQASLNEVFLGALPFTIVNLAAIALLYAFPQLVLFLPQTMKG